MRSPGGVPNQWTVIGAHMVASYAWQVGIRSCPSEDVDVLVNVRLAANLTEEVSGSLRARAYEPEVSRSGIAHLFRRCDRQQIDVFAPDGPGARAIRRTVPPNRTISVPGGSQALARSAPVAVSSGDVEGTVARPNLLGAVLVNVRAIEVDDVRTLSALTSPSCSKLARDPDDLVSDLSRAERRWLERHTYFSDPYDERWAAVEALDREHVALIYRRLLRG